VVTVLPHIAFPWTLNRDGRVVVNEQDSVEEVAACVWAIATCVKGQMHMLPNFGATSPLFQAVPLDLSALVEAVEAQEPRARIMATEQPDAFSAAIRNILLTVEVEAGP
jgi:hypothetical protein